MKTQNQHTPEWVLDAHRLGLQDLMMGPQNANSLGRAVAMYAKLASDRKAEIARLTASNAELVTTIKNLLNTCELNLDDMEDDTHSTIEDAQKTLAKAGTK